MISVSNSGEDNTVPEGVEPVAQGRRSLQKKGDSRCNSPSTVRRSGWPVSLLNMKRTLQACVSLSSQGRLASASSFLQRVMMPEPQAPHFQLLFFITVTSAAII